MVRSWVLSAVITGSLLSLPAQAKLYKWVDDRGVTHYGETIPPEFADKSRSELDKSGRIINTRDVLTPEEHRAKDAAELKNKAVLETERDQKLHDNSLLNTYSNVKEIELAKVRNMQQIDARAQVAAKQLGDANKSLADLQHAADARTKIGKPVPPYLKEDIQSSQVQVDKLSKDLANINAEKATLEARYDADKARYKELTGK
ncbi:MAG: DUF4124 domain-containing protein [Gallionella sp.]|nr:DUF4124 domain-containing protein [Gallionella sp.]